MFIWEGSLPHMHRRANHLRTLNKHDNSLLLYNMISTNYHVLAQCYGPHATRVMTVFAST